MSPARVGRTSGPCRAPAGSKVELVFDPFDLTVRHHGRPAGKATPFKIGQYVHPKAAADTPPSPVTHRGRLPAAAGGPADPCPGRTAPLRPTRRSDSPDRTDAVDRPEHRTSLTTLRPRPLSGLPRPLPSLPQRGGVDVARPQATRPAPTGRRRGRTTLTPTNEGRPSRSEEGHPTYRPPGVDRRCLTADPDFGLVTALVGWYGSMAGRHDRDRDGRLPRSCRPDPRSEISRRSPTGPTVRPGPRFRLRSGDADEPPQGAHWHPHQ